MDKPADPASPFGEVYQSFLDDLALEGTKPSMIHRDRYNIVRFEKWLVPTATGDPGIARADATHRVPPAPGEPAPATPRIDPAGATRERFATVEADPPG